MQKKRIVVVGYGNVGFEVVETVKLSPDMEVVGIVELPHLIEKAQKRAKDVKVVSDVAELGHVDAAILSIGSRAVPKTAAKYLSMGINTTDAFDIHGQSMINLRQNLDKIAKENNAVSVISAGWDPEPIR